MGYPINLVLWWRKETEESFHSYKLMWYFKMYFTQNNNILHQYKIPKKILK